MSSVITISQPPSVPGDKGIHAVPEMTFAELDDVDLAFDSDTGGKSEPGGIAASESEISDTELISLEDAPAKVSLTAEEKAKARGNSLAQLMSGGTAPTRKREVKKLKPRESFGTSEEDELPPPKPYKPAQATVRRRQQANGPEAVIVLKEERVGIPNQFCTPCIFTLGSRRALFTIFSNMYTHSKPFVIYTPHVHTNFVLAA